MIHHWFYLFNDHLEIRFRKHLWFIRHVDEEKLFCQTMGKCSDEMNWFLVISKWEPESKDLENKFHLIFKFFQKENPKKFFCSTKYFNKDCFCIDLLFDFLPVWSRILNYNSHFPLLHHRWWIGLRYHHRFQKFFYQQTLIKLRQVVHHLTYVFQYVLLRVKVWNKHGTLWFF